MDQVALLDAYLGGPDQLRSAVTGLSPAQMISRPIMGEEERAGGRLPPGPTEFLVSSFPEALLAFPPPVSELDETPAHQVMRNLLVDSSQGDLQEKVSIGQLSERPGQVPYCLGQCLS